MGLVLMATLYRAPARVAGVSLVAAWPQGATLAVVTLAVAIWGLVSAPLIIVFGFGPALLTERGMTLAAVAPFGGWLADRTGRRDLVLGIGLVGFAAGMLAVRAGFVPVAGFAAIGIMSALPVGPILSLPAAMLTPQTRAVGMGLFYTVYYVIAVSTPWLVGLFATAAGSAAVTFEAGAAMLGIGVVLLGICRALIARLRRAEDVAKPI